MIIVGAVLMALGSLLAFVVVELDLRAESQGIQSSSLKGLDTDDGKFFLAFGVTLLLLGTVLWAIRSRTWRVVLCGVAVAISGFMVYVGIANITGLPDDALEGLAEQAAPGPQRDQLVDELREFVTAEPGLGLYICTAGAALALMGGLLSLRPRHANDQTHLPAGWTPPDQGPVEARSGESDLDEPWRAPMEAPPVATSEAEREPWRGSPPPE